MLTDAGFDKRLWAETISIVCYLINCGPHISIKCKMHAEILSAAEKVNFNKQVELQEDHQDDDLEQHEQSQELQSEVCLREPIQNTTRKYTI